MSLEPTVIGIVGSYRRDGIVDTVVTEILSAATRHGAKTKKIYLADKHIEFCTNCRECMQAQGTERGKCILEDEMEDILQQVESVSSLVIGSPENFNNVTALTRKFMERCVGYAYWPWENRKPQIRSATRDKKAVLITASGRSAPIIRSSKDGAMAALRYLANILGADTVGTLWVGRVNNKEMELPKPIIRKARRLGRRLATP